MADTSTNPSTAQADPNPSSSQIAEGTESAPLLSQDAPQENPTTSTDPEANASPQNSAPPAQSRPVIILTFLSFALSCTSIIFMTATGITLAAVPFRIYIYWQIQESINFIVPTTIVAAILSLSNIIRLGKQGVFLPLVINIILDILILYCGIGASISGLNFVNRSEISCNAEADNLPCENTALAVMVLLGFAIGAALAVGLVHMVLFVLRCIAAYRTRFWRQSGSGSSPGTWRFPTGTFTVEFSIKLLRQESEREGEREGQIRI